MCVRSDAIRYNGIYIYIYIFSANRTKEGVEGGTGKRNDSSLKFPVIKIPIAYDVRIMYIYIYTCTSATYRTPAAADTIGILYANYKNNVRGVRNKMGFRRETKKIKK